MKEDRQKIKEIVEKELSSSHHDIEHVMRVYYLCLKLARDEQNVDLDVLETAALLHDIGRVKEFEDKTGTVEHATLGAEMAEQILKTLGYTEEKVAQIKHCIAVHRYRRNRIPQTTEAKILFDADKLDSLGAVGVARAFTMAGQFGQRIYSDVSLEDYLKENIVGEEREIRLKNVANHTPNLEFELKFRRIPQRLYTQRAQEIAKERLSFMEYFFKRLKMEIRGELQ